MTDLNISLIRATNSRSWRICFALALCVYRLSCSSLQLGSVFQTTVLWADCKMHLEQQYRSVMPPLPRIRRQRSTIRRVESSVAKSCVRLCSFLRAAWPRPIRSLSLPTSTSLVLFRLLISLNLADFADGTPVHLERLRLPNRFFSGAFSLTLLLFLWANAPCSQGFSCVRSFLPRRSCVVAALFGCALRCRFTNNRNSTAT